MELTNGQRAIVEHPWGSGPCRVTGGFGSGVSTTLARRALRLRGEGLRPLLVPGHDGLVALALDVLRRNGRPVSLVAGAELVVLVAGLLPAGDRPRAPSIADALTGFQASFLGAEELRVHADAAGQLPSAERLIEMAERYRRLLHERNRVDEAGALVSASLLLRDGEVLAAERARFDELLVDDLELATFASFRLLTQLAGQGGNLTIGGNPEAAVSAAPLSSARYLDDGARRLGVVLDVGLTGAHRHPSPPTLRIVADGDEARAAAADAVAGLSPSASAVVSRDLVEASVGREWRVVVVPDATDGRWPAPRPSVDEWFDVELFHGPDVPDADARAQRWLALERRRFAVACSRATDHTVVVAESPVTQFVDLLVTSP